jgi:hypothetical protein
MNNIKLTERASGSESGKEGVHVTQRGNKLFGRLSALSP